MFIKILSISGVFSLTGLLLTTVAYGAVTPEEVFEEASSYTVRIKTRIEHAFGSEQAGAFSGTGFIVDVDRGWIVTNRHVVGESPSEVQIARRHGPFKPAEKLYVDPFVDIAVLKTELDGGENAKLDCDQTVPGTGHPVGAYGHPWELEYTGTQGVISGRTTKWEQVMLQTDAPINSGNSGGPLISMRSGKVVGVSTSSYNAEDAENTNFAVPVDDVCRILSLLKQGRDPSPPNLPVAFFNFEDREEVVVARVFDQERSIGLRAYDQIVAAGPDHVPVRYRHDLMNALRGNLHQAKIRIVRDGQELTVEGNIQAMQVRRGVEFAGIVMAPFNFRDRSLTPAGHDIGVFSIAAGSRGSGKDLKWFDLIYKVDGERVNSLEQLFVLLAGLERDEVVSIEFLRVLEDQHYFGYVQREIEAEPPLWLESSGASEGIDVALAWIDSQIDESTVYEAPSHSRLRASLDSVLHRLNGNNSGLSDATVLKQRAFALAIAERLDERAQAASANNLEVVD
jgi:S1-C subfamily serine protease